MNKTLEKINKVMFEGNFKYIRVRYNHNVLGWQYFYISEDSYIIQRNDLLICNDILLIDNNRIRIDGITILSDRLVNIEVIK